MKVKTLKILHNICIIIALIASHLAVGITAYHYGIMDMGIKYAGYSAPKSTSFLLGAPVLVLAILFLILSTAFNKEINRRNKNEKAVKS